MDDQLRTDPSQGGKDSYPPWMGVVLSFMISGAAQFLAGKRREGLTWFVGILLLGGTSLVVMASPLVPGLMPGITLAVLANMLWIFMLVRSYQPVPKLRRSGWLMFVALGISLPWAALNGTMQGFRAFAIPFNSMAPTLLGKEKLPDGTTIGGDRFFAIPYAYWFSKPERGDIVVFKTAGISPHVPPNELYVKRIIGIPGDILSVKAGRLYNHGQIVSEPASLARMVISNTIPGMQQFLFLPTDTFQVPDGCYFVVGDNTANSYDSRHWGTLPAQNIVGRVSKIYWPLKRMGAVK